MPKSVKPSWKLWTNIDAARSLGELIQQYLFDWKSWALAIGGWALTFFSSALEGWSPTGVWLASLAAGALVMVMVVAVRVAVDLKPRGSSPLATLIAINNEGVALLNEGNVTLQVGAWTFKFSDWHRRILEAAEAYSPELRNRLEPIKRFTVPDEPVAVNDQSHKVNVKIVAEIMHRVDVWLKEKAKR